MARSKNSGYGLAFINGLEAIVPNMGNVFVVKAAADTADNNYQKLQDIMTPDNDGRVRFFTSLSDAYDATATNNNDVILLDSHSNHILTSWLTVSKSRINFIGMDSGDRLVQQWAKIWLTTAATTAYAVYNTWNRNTFRNIKFINASTNAWSLNVVKESWEWTLYKNCSMIFETATNLGWTTAQELLFSGDSCTFLNCTIWSDTLLTSAWRPVVLFKTDSAEPKSNVFKECNFLISSSSNAATFVRLNAITDILFTNVFDRCNFMASVDSAGWAAVAEVVQTWTGTNKWTLCFAYPSAFNVTAFAVATGGRNVWVQVVAPTSVATTFKWILPTG